MVEWIHSTQSAMKRLVSPCLAALRFEQKTIFALIGGEKPTKFLESSGECGFRVWIRGG